MTRESAKSMDQRSSWISGTAETPGKPCRPPMASPEPGRMLAFAPFHGFIWGMSVKSRKAACEPHPVLPSACLIQIIAIEAAGAQPI